jgi:ketosteroid isomerase-like protein
MRAELDALGRAVVDRDATRIQRLVADDYTFTQPDTVVSGKRDLLASIDPRSDFRYLEHRVTEIHTRAYGVAVVSNGRFFVRATYDGKTVAHGVRFTAVHVRRDDRWQLVALHSTIEP